MPDYPAAMTGFNEEPLGISGFDDQFPTVALGDIARLVVRPVPVVPGEKYRTIGVKWWGEGAYERATIDGTQTSARSLSLVRTDDLVINKIWVRHGSVAIASQAVDGCSASAEFPTFELDQCQVVPRWLHWLTKTQGFWASCDQLSRGTSGKNRIRPELFLTIRVVLPSLEEQHRIVSRIEAVANRVQTIRQLDTEIQETGQRMLNSTFQRLVRGASLKPLDEVAPLTRRAVDINSTDQYSELGIRSFGRGTFHKATIAGADIGSKRLFQIHPGDLLFNNVFAWEGAVAVARDVDRGRVGSHRFITCIPHRGIVTAKFLRFFFLSPEGLRLLGEASPGGAGRNRTLGLRALAKIEVPVPAYESQLWFDSLQDRLESAGHERMVRRSRLDLLLPAVLDRATRGQL